MVSVQIHSGLLPVHVTSSLCNLRQYRSGMGPAADPFRPLRNTGIGLALRDYGRPGVLVQYPYSDGTSAFTGPRIPLLLVREASEGK